MTINNGKNVNKEMLDGTLTVESHMHPMETGMGGVLGAAAGIGGATAAGALAGGVAGPLGMAAGGMIGGIIGALTGKTVAEAANPTENAHWKEMYDACEYADKTVGYEEYKPAYKYGAAARGHYPNAAFDEVERELGNGWENVRGKSGLVWDDARHAARDAFNRGL